jgi:hypothetical protein
MKVNNLDWRVESLKPEVRKAAVSGKGLSKLTPAQAHIARKLHNEIAFDGTGRRRTKEDRLKRLDLLSRRQMVVMKHVLTRFILTQFNAFDETLLSGVSLEAMSWIRPRHLYAALDWSRIAIWRRKLSEQLKRDRPDLWLDWARKCRDNAVDVLSQPGLPDGTREMFEGDLNEALRVITELEALPTYSGSGRRSKYPSALIHTICTQLEGILSAEMEGPHAKSKREIRLAAQRFKQALVSLLEEHKLSDATVPTLGAIESVLFARGRATPRTRSIELTSKTLGVSRAHVESASPRRAKTP